MNGKKNSFKNWALVNQTAIASQEVMMFVKLRKVSIGTKKVQYVAAKLVQAKLAM